ncbi:MAG: Fungal specific transcription factor, partial [Pleopsidium flavum]
LLGAVPAPANSGYRNHETPLDGQGSTAGTSETLEEQQNEADKVAKLVSNIGMVSSLISSASSERGGVQTSKSFPNGAGDASVRISFFGLHIRPTIKQAPFPNKDLGTRLVSLYFDHANSQIPILHVGEFTALYDKVYSSEEESRTPRELYMFNIVVAIGAGIILGDSDPAGSSVSAQSTLPVKRDPTFPSINRQKLPTRQDQPEKYHASAIVQLESFLGTSSPSDRPNGFRGGLEESSSGPPSFRSNLDLHYEDGTWIEGKGGGLDPTMGASVVAEDAADGQGDYRVIGAKERGRQEWHTITPAFRLLQSEILQVLQYQQVQQARASGITQGNEYMHAQLPSPFLRGFDSFRSWREVIDRRLWEWKGAAPMQQDITVQFSTQFLELNYWQAVIVLYRQSLSVP